MKNINREKTSGIIMMAKVSSGVESRDSQWIYWVSGGEAELGVMYYPLPVYHAHGSP